MNEMNWVDAVKQAYHGSDLEGITALILLRDWVSQEIDSELDRKNGMDDD